MNIDALLSPISDALPCGDDLSFSAEFDGIAELRREDDPTLAQGEWVTPLKSADWPAAEARCTELLSTRSKDLRLAMWLAEAAAMNRGYAGLREGLELCAGLCQRYWDGLHPQADEGDMEQRIGNIGWLLNRVVALSTQPAVTQGRGGAHSLQQLKAARALQAVLDRSPDKAAQLSADTLTLDKFNRALHETPKAWLRDTLHTLQACLDALAAWQGVIDARFGADGPGFVPAREALAAARHEVLRLAREAGALDAEDVAAEADVPALPGAAEARRAAHGPLRTREQALAQLREVAAYFRSTEPHSPVAYLAEKAVRWGDMPLHLWLRSVVKDAGALSHLEELLGLEGPGPGG